LLLPPLPPGTGSVRGVVLDEDGKPVAGATVFAAGTAYKPSAVSNDEGQFLLQGLAPGNWGLLAYKKSHGYPANFFAFFSSTGNVQVPSVDVVGGKVTEKVTVRLGPKAAYLNFEITDETGKPLGASASFTRPDMAAGGEFKSSVGAKEKFLVPPVPFRLELQAEGCEPWDYGGSDWKSDKGLIKLKPEESLILPVRLRCANLPK
jgi:Carboxypeptidase regulatory-like domain